jgi:hypothetical protein
MVASRYEKYIVRKPAIIKRVTPEYVSIEVPKGDKIPAQSSVDTGPLVICSEYFLKDTTTKVEYGFIMGDTEIGTGKGFGAYKHNYGEIFVFLGTNPHDTQYLGAETEYWLGEGESLEKVKFTTSSSIYVLPGVAHFPLIWRNVKNPVMMVVIVPTTSKHKAISVKR